MIERSVDFDRTRRMRCGSCGHEWPVTADWLDRFEEALEACPVCHTDCRSEYRPDFCAHPEDPVHDDSAVRGMFWYHSSTHTNWPDRNFDPAAELTDDTKRRMETLGSGPGAVEQWALRQKAKALHIGTYEAAIESMFRRMCDQASSFDQFYMYRIELDPGCVIKPGVHQEPTNWVGDAYLSDVCPPGTNVLRYVNVHEDQSSVSLAVELSAIRAVQGIPIPLVVDLADPWILGSTQRLFAAASEPLTVSEREPEPWQRLRRQTSPLVSEARGLESEVAASLPSVVRRRFRVGFDEVAFATAPSAFPMKLLGMANLVTKPHVTLDSLNAAQRWRLLEP